MLFITITLIATLYIYNVKCDPLTFSISTGRYSFVIGSTFPKNCTQMYLNISFLLNFNIIKRARNKRLAYFVAF